jgi:hypothetical protein
MENQIAFFPKQNGQLTPIKNQGIDRYIWHREKKDGFRNNTSEMEFDGRQHIPKHPIYLVILGEN